MSLAPYQVCAACKSNVQGNNESCPVPELTGYRALIANPLTIQTITKQTITNCLNTTITKGLPTSIQTIANRLNTNNY
jgi:hypothetical protein